MFFSVSLPGESSLPMDFFTFDSFLPVTFMNTSSKVEWEIPQSETSDLSSEIHGFSELLNWSEPESYFISSSSGLSSISLKSGAIS